MGVLIEPYYFYQEWLPADPVPPRLSENAGYRFLELGVGQTEAIAALDPNTDTSAQIRGEFAMGRRCFAITHGGTVVGASWIDTAEIHFPPCRRTLDADEAYIFRTEILYSYRGRNIATLLRARLYAFLRSEGRKRVYSYTDYFNYPAVRFKNKIGASALFVGLYVGLFGLASKNWVIRRPRRGAGGAAPTEGPAGG